MGRYWRMLGVSVRASLATAMQYRADFIINGFISLWWMLWTLVPLLVAFSGTQSVAGWSVAEAMLVVAWFTALRGLLEGLISPALAGLVDGIRTGSLDFVLLKPADAQFLVSTRQFIPWKVFDLLAAVVMAVWGLAKIGRMPTPGDLAVSFLLLIAAATLLYSIFVLVGCAAFWVVRLDNLSYLFGSIFDFARWPVQVFRGTWRIVFTFVIPLGILTTYPAMALLGRLDLQTTLFAFGGAALFALISRAAWLRSIGAYTSASS